MIVKTAAIVFSAIKYSEADLIVTCYTEAEGIRSYLLKNIKKSKRSAMKPSHFQPLTQLEIVANHRNKGHLEYLKEVKNLYLYSSIHTDVVKGTLAIFIAEILQHSIREEQPNPDLFKYLSTSLDWLDKNEKFANFHISFLLGLSQYLGFSPDSSRLDQPVFNLMEGRFEPSKSDLYSVEGHQVEKLKSFLNKDHLETSTISLSRNERAELLDLLITYFQLHIQSFPKPKSLSVLQQVFH